MFLLTHFSEKVIQQAEVNQMKEKLMHDALQSLEAVPFAEIKDKMQQHQKRNNSRRLLKRTLDDTSIKQSQSYGKTYNIYCRKCPAFICASTDLFIVKNTHHVVIQPEFKPKVLIKESEGTKKGALAKDVNIVGSIHCANCGIGWGKTMIFDGVTLPALAIKKIQFQHIDGTAISTQMKTWQNVKRHLFVPKDIQISDLPVAIQKMFEC